MSDSKLQKYKRLSANTLVFAAANIAAKIINFLLVPLYTNIMSTAQYGTAELILNCTNIIIPLVSLSISDALLRFGLDKKKDSNSVLKSTFIVLSIGSIICFAFTPIYSKYEGIGSYALLFSILCISQMLRSTMSLYTKTIQNNKLFAIDTIVYTFSLAVYNIFFLVCFKLEINGYILSYIFANLTSLILISLNVKLPQKLLNGKADKLLLREMLKYSLPMIFNALSWWVIHFSDRIMLEQMMSSSDVGLYSAASKVPNILSTVLSVFTQAWTISSVLEYDNEREEKFYSNIFKIYCIVLTLGASFLNLIIKPFMSIYVGSSFISSWIYVPLLILGTTYAAISSFVGPIYGAAKKNVAATLTTVFAGVVNIGCNYFLILKYGIMGAVIATVIADFMMGFIRLFDTRRFFKFKIEWAKVLISFLAVTIQSIMVTLEILPIFISIIAILVNFGVYAMDIKHFVQSVLEYLKKKEERYE